MKISVVIPTFNRAALLQETLDSVLQEQQVGLEVIVIDDNSTDDTITMLENYARNDSRVSYHIKPHDSPKGPSASRNIGAQQATGDYVHFFDSDDLIEENFYSELTQQLKLHQPDAFLCRMKWFEGSRESIKGVSGAFGKEDFLSKGILQEHDFWTQNIIWKRAVLNNGSALFDERLTMSEDIEFAIRKLAKAVNIEFSNTLFVLIRRHPMSLTFISNLKREREIAVSRYFAHKSILDVMHRKPISAAAVIKCSFCIRQSLLFLLKVNGVNGFFIRNAINGFRYSPINKWPGYTIGIASNFILFVRKGSKWEKEGGFGRSF